MADSVTFEMDTTDFFAAIDAAPEVVARQLKRVAKVTADHIDAEATGRVRRRTGKTAEKIVVAEAYRGDGYVVYVARPRTFIGRFNEFGTKFMTARPFLFVSARLEEGNHLKRSVDAVQDALNETGLGD